jgi:D-alanyl-D-alanine carboxypeptidase
VRHNRFDIILKIVLVVGIVLIIILGAYILFQIHTERSAAENGAAETAAAENAGGKTGSDTLSESAVKAVSETPENIAEEGLTSAASSSAAAMPDPSKYNTADNWALILVNSSHPYPNGYTVPVTTIENGQSTDSRCADQLQQMLADCRAAGHDPLVVSGYRTHSQQIQDFESMTAMYMSGGYSEEEAKAKTAESVAIPGTSEHETALSADIGCEHNTAIDSSQDEEETQKWLHENCWKYGYALRYPEGKQDITKIVYESWHYRYVGMTAAKVMYDENLCLEEYLQKYVEPFTSLEELDRQAMETLGLAYTGSASADS